MSAEESSGVKDRGASLVEFAILLPVLALLLLGTITGGLALSRQNSVKNAVREATRFSAVAADFTDNSTLSASLTAMYAQVVAGATGDLDTGVSDREICVALIDEAGKWSYQLYGTSATPTASAIGATTGVPTECTDGFDATIAADKRRVWVRAARSSKVDAVLYSADWQFDSHALTRFEG